MKYGIEYIVKKDFLGTIKIIKNRSDFNKVNENDIILLLNTSPDVILLFNKIKGVIIEIGGQTSHLTIIARESNMPLIRLNNAKEIITDGDFVKEVEGNIYVNEN
ncbi:MAG: PEP-utilizing enzyme [Candidatus ainarchaeum sp.]|nr:PEP-utilizing enzyme [Candidatus ainarchaeum sp.]